MVGGGKGNVIVKEAGKFSCEGQGELGFSVGDDSVMKAELEKDMLKKDFGDVHHGGSLVARVENYPLRKAMVYHNQNRVKATEGRQSVMRSMEICWKGQVQVDEMGARGRWAGWVLTLLA